MYIFCYIKYYITYLIGLILVPKCPEMYDKIFFIMQPCLPIKAMRW